MKKHKPLDDLADLINNTTLRPSNECDLEWSWIRWDEEMIIVPKEFHKQKNEGRYLLNSEMVNMLRRRQKEDLKFEDDFPFVFWRTENGSKTLHKISKRWIERKWTAVMEEACIKNLHFYDLKHTCLSKLAATGANVFLLKVVSNHTTTASLERYVKRHALVDPAFDLLNRMNGVKNASEK
jgi:integrase